MKTPGFVILRGELLALFSAFAFGLGSVAIAKGAGKASVESGVLLSALMTALLSGTAWLFSGGGLPAAEAELPIVIGWFAVSGLLATVGGRITMYKSIVFAGVIRASTARRMMPFISLLLGWLLLNEHISKAGAAGMAMIAVSFILLVWTNRTSIQISTDDPIKRATISRGLMFGLVSAFLYALSFVARKFGLIEGPDPFFGALVGSLTAIGFYCISCAVSLRYRSIVSQTLTAPNEWHLFAALLISVGQISQFGALMFTDIGRVAFINSVEVYIAGILAIFVFKTEPMPCRLIVIGTLLATAGVVLIIAHA